jgi:hypothetical protein
MSKLEATHALCVLLGGSGHRKTLNEAVTDAPAPCRLMTGTRTAEPSTPGASRQRGTDNPGSALVKPAGLYCVMQHANRSTLAPTLAATVAR